MDEQKQENIVIEEKGKKIKPKKTGFFKKMWYSIAKFEKYVEMSLEGTGRALKYLLQITSLFVIIISCIGLYNVNKNFNDFIKNVEDNVPDFSYSDGKIELAPNVENKVYTISDKNLNFGKIIVDLNVEDENIITQYEEEIKNDEEVNNIGMIILKDKVIQVVKLDKGEEGETRISMSYDEVIESLLGDTTNIEITKASLLEYLNGSGKTSILLFNFFVYFVGYFILYLCSGLIYALILALIGYTSNKLSKINLKFSQLFAMSIYAFTLSNILNVIYFIVNYFARITIKYFDIAYMAIAYIYLITVLFLIKNDTLRKQENQIKDEKKEEKEETDGQEQI